MNIIKESEHIMIFIVPSKEELINKREDKNKQYHFRQLYGTIDSSKIIDLYTYLCKLGPATFRDDVRFNEVGHKIIADIIMKKING